MKLSTLLRLGITSITAVLASSTIGFYLIKIDYPEAKYYERIQSIVASNVFPAMIIGIFEGLMISNWVIRKYEIDKDKKLADDEKLRELLELKLTSPDISLDESVAIIEVLSKVKSEIKSEINHQKVEE